MTRDQWICPRCGLEGDNLRSLDALRCKVCCASDAGLNLLRACIMTMASDSFVRLNTAAQRAIQEAVAEAEGRVSRT